MGWIDDVVSAARGTEHPSVVVTRTDGEDVPVALAAGRKRWQGLRRSLAALAPLAASWAVYEAVPDGDAAFVAQGPAVDAAADSPAASAPAKPQVKSLGGVDPSELRALGDLMIRAQAEQAASFERMLTPIMQAWQSLAEAVMNTGMQAQARADVLAEELATRAAAAPADSPEAAKWGALRDLLAEVRGKSGGEVRR